MTVVSDPICSHDRSNHASILLDALILTDGIRDLYSVPENLRLGELVGGNFPHSHQSINVRFTYGVLAVEATTVPYVAAEPPREATGWQRTSAARNTVCL